MTAVRRAGKTSAATLSGIAIALAAANLVAPAWARGAGLDVWNLPEAQAGVRDCDREADRLQEEAIELHRQIETADHATARLVAGSMSLAAATDVLEPVLKARPGFEVVRGQLHAPTHRLTVARYLISRIQLIPDADPAARAAAACRLEAEYAAME